MLEHRDIDRDKRVIHVRRTLSGGKVKAMGKTARSRRQVPLQQAAIDALDLQPVNGKLVFPTLAGQRLSLNNWRNRVWYPAIDAGGIQRPAGCMTCVPRSRRTRQLQGAGSHVGPDHGHVGEDD